MNSRTTRLIFASLSLVARLAVPVLANDPSETPGWEISLSPGAAIPVQDNANGLPDGQYKNSFVGQASIIRAISSDIGLGLEGGYSTGHDYDFQLDPFTQYWLAPSDNVRIAQLTPILELGRWFGTVKPYVILGGGLYNVKETVEANFLGYRYSATQSENFAGANGGVGLLVRVGDHLSLGPDLRYHRIFAGNKGFDFHYVTTSFRLAFLF